MATFPGGNTSRSDLRTFSVYLPTVETQADAVPLITPAAPDAEAAGDDQGQGDQFWLDGMVEDNALPSELQRAETDSMHTSALQP